MPKENEKEITKGIILISCPIFIFTYNLTLEPIVFTIGHEPMISVDIMDINGNWVPVSMLLDSGNMRTLINMETTRRLGWDIRGDGTIPVQGVFGAPMQVPINHEVILKIGDTKPIMTSIMMADQTDMCLLGFDVIQQYFTVIFDGNQIILEQKDQGCEECEILGAGGFGNQQPFF
jgi:hypothetical protein